MNSLDQEVFDQNQLRVPVLAKQHDLLVVTPDVEIIDLQSFGTFR